MPYCKGCGREIEEDAAFCSHCGRPVRVSDVTYQRPRVSMWNVGSILAVLFGGLLILVSLGLLLGGGAVIWVQSTFSDSEGFLMSREVRLQSDSYAMVFQDVNIDIDVDVPADIWAPKPGDFVTVKLVGMSNDPSKELFIGIARDTDASEYLKNVKYDRVLFDPSWVDETWEISPGPRGGIRFSVSRLTHPGVAPSQAPDSMWFWEASATGSGPQTILWEPTAGSFWVVVMNADGSENVDMHMRLGAKIPILRIIGGGLLAGGFIILGIGGFIVYYGVFRPWRERTRVSRALTTTQMIVIIAIVVVAISGIYYFTQRARGYSYRVPEQTNDGWETASLANVGMDEAPIVEMMNGLSRQNEDHIHSIVIIKDGMLVFEEYFSGEDLDLTEGLNFSHKDFDSDTLHCQASASKSVTSILLGIAIDQGLVSGVEEKMFSFYPEHSDLEDTGKGEITLQHMLSMSSGIPWDESYAYTDPRNNLNQQFYSEDPIRYLLEQPVVAPPGTTFMYNSGTTNVLGDIVRISSGQTLMEFADQHLFTPLGITSYDWVGFPLIPHIAVTSSTLYLRPRDMAKIGQLYLQGGEWNGDRIISQEWIVESTSETIRIPPSENPIPGLINGYGYQWWRGTFSNGDIETYFAAGWGGQFIYVLPELDMVITLTGGHFEGDYQGFYSLINDHILSTVE